MSTPPTLIAQGAEGRIYSEQFCGKIAVVKERFKKSYRLPELDEKLTQKRIKQEVRCFVKARKAGVDTPCLYLVDMTSRKIYMELVEGGTVKTWLRNNQICNPEGALEIARNIGIAIAKLHNSNIVHGDLTTSNIMLRKPLNSIVLIDFGLSASTGDIEEKAVDLHLMEKALISSHENAQPLVDEILRVYKASCTKSDRIMQRLAGVRQRGRKRDMVG